jgi:hypothetical protein
MLFSYKDWCNEFSTRLFNTRRWEGFQYLARELSKVESPKLLEVGCIRTKDGWESDGQSTRVWDWMVHKSDGRCYSFDISEKSVSLARSLCPNVGVYLADGMDAILSNHYSCSENLDLLFLDGMDFTGPHSSNAWMQHIGLLACAWPNLKKGCLIAVDDCVDNNEGKHVLIKDFFNRMGIKPEVESYMHIWRMP